jgi:hypothetical protein
LLCATSRPVWPSLSVTSVSQPARMQACVSTSHHQHGAARTAPQTARAGCNEHCVPASMRGCRHAARPWSHAQSQAGISNSLSTASIDLPPPSRELFAQPQHSIATPIRNAQHIACVVGGGQLRLLDCKAEPTKRQEVAVPRVVLLCHSCI